MKKTWTIAGSDQWSGQMSLSPNSTAQIIIANADSGNPFVAAVRIQVKLVDGDWEDAKATSAPDIVNYCAPSEATALRVGCGTGDWSANGVKISAAWAGAVQE